MGDTSSECAREFESWHALPLSHSLLKLLFSSVSLLRAVSGFTPEVNKVHFSLE